MRTLLVAMLIASSLPICAVAQTSSPASPASPASPSARARGGDITRDEYVQRAVERARRAAETRFDRMDTNHDGILTADERRAARTARRSSSQSQ